MEAALQTQVKTEPVNAFTTAGTEKKKSRPKGAMGSRSCFSCGGPFPHQESSGLQERVKEALSKRMEKNDKMSRKRSAKKRDLRIGDHVLVHNRRSGSKFLLPFEKDPWVVSAIKGTMITAKRNHETINRNILFFKAFHMANGEMERDQIPPQTSLFDDGDE
ncbi:hypothetical protein NDU88_006632 [Pleurodeles waltl]|uniref:Uncharacterized protein n=1 Tax=Pleurodeles waltl TaxID=8319 RepID=A0AAV7WF15_PLEWA|nr:hypothetical protein NDU88_006632 [Pleurodeles waltl]